MAKKTKSSTGEVPSVPRPQVPWARTNGSYLAGRAYIDAADQRQLWQDEKWGVGRMRLLVEPELRAKYDRQRYLFNQAIWHGDLETLKREAERMVKAHIALDHAAGAAGEPMRDPRVLEVPMANGSVAAIVGDPAHVEYVRMNEDRKILVYTADEIGRLLDAFPSIAEVKAIFPGSLVEGVRRPDDPLANIRDSDTDLDDPVDDIYNPIGG